MKRLLKMSNYQALNFLLQGLKSVIKFYFPLLITVKCGLCPGPKSETRNKLNHIGLHIHLVIKQGADDGWTADWRRSSDCRAAVDEPLIGQICQIGRIGSLGLELVNQKLAVERCPRIQDSQWQQMFANFMRITPN